MMLKIKIDTLKIQSKLKHALVSVGLFLLVFSCNVTKYIPEDKLLYTGAELKMDADSLIKDPDLLKGILKEAIFPEPNSKILGMQPGLYLYYKTQREKPGFINRWLYKKLGEEPVYKSDVEPFEVEELLLNRLENRGFFYGTANSEFIDDEENKRSKAIYHVKVPSAYKMATYQLDSFPPPLSSEMPEIHKNTKFFEGMRFDLNNMKLERERIDFALKSKGYYNFNPSFILFEADTNQYTNKRFDLYVRLSNDVPEKSIKPYKIKSLNIYADYDIDKDPERIEGTRFNNKTFIQDKDPIYMKPKHLDPFLKLEEDQYYDPKKSSSTARRLSSIGAYKYVNIQYKELDSIATDSLAFLEANIFLSPLSKRAFHAEIQAVTKSNNFAGPALALTYANRNLFKGGELLNITAKAGYEKQFGGSNGQQGLSSLTLGLSGDLSFPRMIFPIKIENEFFEYSVPRTVTGIGIDYLDRTQLYQLVSGKANFGYVWNANRFITHEINPISMQYTRLSKTTEAFQEILDGNPFLQRSFEQEFISGLTYSFTYNGMVDQQSTHQFYLQSTVDIAGNSISLFGKQPEEGGPKTIFGQQYAQYAKADVDFHYHYKIDQNNTIATRFFAGYGLPYGNSDVVPYVKQYFSGGPYSVRAFKIRALGPGTYDNTSNDQGSFFDRTGNIRLEANIEYRFPIYGFFKGAVFADAGNIWLSKSSEVFDGQGEFSGNFLSELGMGAGLGLRVDVQGFVIRLDLAAPFHDPARPEGERFNFDLSSPVLNFGIGYPF